MDNRNKEFDLSGIDEPIVENEPQFEENNQEYSEENSEDLESNFDNNQANITNIPSNNQRPEEEIDYKDKFVESTREASALYFKNQKLNQVIEEAANIAEPTLDEMRDYAKLKKADYDDLDEFSQNVLMTNYINEKRFEKILNVAQESKQIDAWATKVDSFIEDAVDNSKYPSLNSLGADFKKFAMKESRRGVDLDDLVASFLFSAERSIKQAPKKSVLLSGGNSTAAPIKSAGINDKQAAFIRENDPKEYRRLIKSGQINIEI